MGKIRDSTKFSAWQAGQMCDHRLRREIHEEKKEQALGKVMNLVLNITMCSKDMLVEHPNRRLLALQRGQGVNSAEVSEADVFFTYVWIVFLLSGLAIRCGVVKPLVLLHQCNQSVIIPAAVVINQPRAETAFLAPFYRDLQHFLPRCQEAIAKVRSSIGAHTYDGSVSLRKIQEGVVHF